MRKLRILAGLGTLLFCFFAKAQVTFPVNGVADPRTGCYAFTNATVVKDGQTTLNNATLVIRDGRITAIATNAAIPKDAVVINCSGKWIYPSLIDIYTDYGIPVQQRQAPAAGGAGGGFFGQQQFTSNTKGAYGSNQAIPSDINDANILTVDEKNAKTL